MGNRLYEEAITNKKDSVRIIQSLGNSLPALSLYYKSTPTFERTSKVQNPFKSLQDKGSLL